MVSELDSGSIGLALSPGRRHGVVFLHKTLSSISASPPRCINGHQHFNTEE